MPRNHRIRKRHGTPWTSESSARANKARWDRSRAERMDDEAERLLELAAFPPVTKGDPIGCLQYHDFLTGRVRRWTVMLGDRRDRVVLRAPDGRTTRNHGWAWVCDRLRRHLCGGASGAPPPSFLLDTRPTRHSTPPPAGAIFAPCPPPTR